MPQFSLFGNNGKPALSVIELAWHGGAGATSCGDSEIAEHPNWHKDLDVADLELDWCMRPFDLIIFTDATHEAYRRPVSTLLDLRSIENGLMQINPNGVLFMQEQKLPFFNASELLCGFNTLTIRSLRT